MHLALGGARADRAPGDQVADVLRRDHVEELAARGHAGAVDLHQQLPRDAQALVDAVALVEVGIVDQALPAHRGARLLEVHAHHDLEPVGVLVALQLQLAGVLDRRCRVVDGARSHHHQQAVVLALHDVADRRAGVADQLLDRRAGDREEADQVLRRRQRHHVLDPLVVGLAGAFAVRIPTFAGGLGGHGGGLLVLFRVSGTQAEKKTAGRGPGGFGFGALSLSAKRLPLHPPGGARTKSTQKRRTSASAWAEL